MKVLTPESHHADREDLFVFAVGRDVTKSNARHAGQSKVKRRCVGHGVVRSTDPHHLTSVIRHHVAHVDLSTEALQPTVLDSLRCLHVSDREPDASEPVGDENEHDYEENEDSCTVFDVVVQLTSNTTKAQQTNDLQSAEQTAHVLCIEKHDHYPL